MIPAPLFSQDAGTSAELSGNHLELVTDDLNYAQSAELVQVFDAAVPKWGAALGIPQERLSGFRVRAYLFESRARMLSMGVLPSHVPEFLHGIHRDDQVWVVREPTIYATRHLLLHEGVHAIMGWAFGGSGPGWFSEGYAEHLATHTWNQGKVEVGMIPSHREAFPYWGRIDLIEMARKENKLPGLAEVLSIRSSPKSDNEPYAWSWSLVTMLLAYPEYRPVMLSALKHGENYSDQFTHQLIAQLKPGGEELRQRWRLWMHSMDYGYDVNRQLLPSLEAMVSQSKASVSIAADQDWLPVLRGLAAGSKIELRAEGQATLGTKPKPWVSEPQGITIQYFGGRPIGELQALIMDSPAEEDGHCRALTVIPIGRQTTIVAPRGGLLLLRINDHVGQRSDNSGSYTVATRPL